jgi:hypothetical protein
MWELSMCSDPDGWLCECKVDGKKKKIHKDFYLPDDRFFPRVFSKEQSTTYNEKYSRL